MHGVPERGRIARALAAISRYNARPVPTSTELPAAPASRAGGLPAWSTADLPAPPPFTRAQRAARHRPGGDPAGDGDRRRRVARGPGGRREIRRDDHGHRDDRHRAAARVQPRGDPLHALHRRADLHRVHAARAGAHVVGGRLRRADARAARVAGARAHRRRYRVQHGGGAPPRQRSSATSTSCSGSPSASSWSWRCCCSSAARSSACSSTRRGACSLFIFTFLIVANVMFVPAVDWWRTLARLLHHPHARRRDRLGPARRARRHRGIGRRSAT